MSVFSLEQVANPIFLEPHEIALDDKHTLLDQIRELGGFCLRVPDEGREECFDPVIDILNALQDKHVEITVDVYHENPSDPTKLIARFRPRVDK